ncbi:MAG: flavin reductase family protein [Kiloniellales bacterium]|nr:flavin reductase family protein [Kiloniellales bacterium]
MGEGRTERQRTYFDEPRFRDVLRQFATGITVVTGRDEERRPRAVTVNSFASVSLDPPLVLYCLGRSAFNFDVFAKAKAFAINILSADQQALSDRFAREAEDELADLELTELETGSPVLSGCLAVLDCETEKIHEAGDHLIIVGRVAALDLLRESDPLIYFRSRYRNLKS